MPGNRSLKNANAVTSHSFYETQGPSLATLVSDCLLHSLTNSYLIDLTDVTLAFEDANSKLLDIVSFADVGAEDRVDYSLVQIWKQKFGHEHQFPPKLVRQNFVIQAK